MSESKSCDHCGAGPDEPCQVGCTCGRDGDVSETKHCRNRYLCKLHDCACPCDGCLPHSDPEAHENRTLRADVARLTRERDAARAAYASASREWAERHEHARERIQGLTGERDAALRWSSLWHREARRLWREVQALSEHVEGDQ